jgi:AcrR family transcriptional regulator
MARLAGTHPSRGLPRGRGSLPPEQVALAQRERMLRAMTSAVAELGYANVRIADVVDRARVSRQSFYGQFADREACFLAAHAQGMGLILERLGRWASDGDDPLAQLRGAIRAYLALAAEEPEFAHCMLIELPAVGRLGLTARLAAHDQIADLLRIWHARARAHQSSWPEVPEGRYRVAVGAVHELVFTAVAEGRSGDAPSLEDEAVDAVVTLLRIPAGR